MSKISLWIVLLALAATVVVYSNGLNGPFLFDDHIHITQNQWVKIESLSWADLVRAWNSSFSAFPEQSTAGPTVVRHQPCPGRSEPLGIQGHQPGHPPVDRRSGFCFFPSGLPRGFWQQCRQPARDDPAHWRDRCRLAAPPAARQHRALHGAAHGATVDPEPAGRPELLFLGTPTDCRGQARSSDGSLPRHRLRCSASSAKKTPCCCHCCCWSANSPCCGQVSVGNAARFHSRRSGSCSLRCR